MAEINVNFLLPVDGKVINVTVEDSMTAENAIGHLLANNLLTAHPDGYQLGVVGGAILASNQSFAAAGIKSDSKLKIIPATDAGNCGSGEC